MDEETARELIAATRKLADALEDSLGGPVLTTPPPDGPVRFDPETDPPPFKADPDGDRREKDLTDVILFGRLYALNRRHGMGAGKKVSRDIAQAAGYQDARAWSGWEKYAVVKDDDGLRWVNETGHKWLVEHAEAARILLPEDLAVWVAPR